MTLRVVRNDWSTIEVPDLGRWRPELPVSVVIPAHQCQASLDLTLAALSRQTYPPELLEVVVVDDGSQPPLRLPELRPEHCRMLRLPDGWGRAAALHFGAQHSDGAVLHWLDADMVPFPSHVEAQLRWQHRLPYAVTLGGKQFVDVRPGGSGLPEPAEVAAAGAAGTMDRLFVGIPSTGHDYVERQIARTDRLRAADHLGFLAHVGATAALRRELYHAAGGLDPELKLGEDTELGYRLAQAGAVFVPEPAAQSWHLGATHMMRHREQLQRYNQPFLADRMPHPRWLRKVGGSAWAVPLVLVVMEVSARPLEQVRVAVDSVLTGDEPDVQLVLIGPWENLATADRVPPLADPQLELRLIAASYRSDPRVRLAAAPPESGFPAPYLLEVPASYALAPGAVRRLVEYADRERLGLVRAGPLTLWRTAARSRAGWVRRSGEDLATVVAEVAGAGALPAGTVGVADLSDVPADRLRAPVTVPAGGWLATSVEVAGFRSLARAAWTVARHAARRCRRRLRGITPPGQLGGGEAVDSTLAVDSRPGLARSRQNGPHADLDHHPVDGVGPAAARRPDAGTRRLE